MLWFFFLDSQGEFLYSPSHKKQHLIKYLGQYEHRWSDVMVAALAFTIPIIIIYVFFQKYVVGGLLGGAIKG